MKTNPVKEKLRRGEPSIGSWISLGSLQATRVMARLGFDWLTVDIEHGPFDWSEAAMLFAAIADAGCVPLARVPQGSHDYIKRVLDAGAFGIVVPMVDTVEQAKTAIAAAKYPPEGTRSVGGGMHSLNFDATAGDYYEKANDEILVVLQTESPTGVENAEEIYSLPGVDAIFVGPNDLRFQMREPGRPLPDNDALDAMLERVVAAGNKTGTPTGMHVMDPGAVNRRIEQGMRFLALASDLRFVTSAAQEALKIVNPEKESKDVARY